MTLLLELPAELLLSILGYVGSLFFHEDTGRLLLSKRWYQLAWQVLVRDLDLNARSITKLTEDEKLLERCHPYIATVSIFLQGYEATSHAAQADPSDPLSLEILIKAAVAWTKELNSRLTSLGALLQRCPGLRRLEIKAGPETPELGLRPRCYLFREPIARCLSLRHLTTLEFDTAGSFADNYPVDSQRHVCSVINTLLPSLRRLRCRMDTLCENLLDPPKPGKVRLKEVIVNLSLANLSPFITAYRHPSPCWEANRHGGFLRLEELMENQAVALVSRLEKPRMVRVISHQMWRLG